MLLSDSQFNTSFTERIETIVNRETNFVSEEDWIVFLQDHRDLIKERSVYFELTEEVMMRYRYRIRDFLIYVKLSPDTMQAFMILNRLNCDQDFNLSLTGVLLPDKTHITELRKLYYTNKALQKRNS